MARKSIEEARAEIKPSPVGEWYRDLSRHEQESVEDWEESHKDPNREIEKSTPRIYKKWLKRFLFFHRCTPSDTLRWSESEINNRMERYKQHLVKRGLAKNTIVQSWSAIKRWYYDNNITLTRKCEGLRGGKRQYDHIPSMEQLDIILNATPLHYRVAFALVAFSGMRPIDVSELRYGDIKGSLSAGDDTLTISLVQLKTNDRYVTFLGPQGTAYVRELLHQREINGEGIRNDSFVASQNGKRLIRRQMRHHFRKAVKRTIGLNPTGESFRVFRLYGLRKYFRFSLKDLNEAEAEFVMGHKAAADSLKGLSRTYSGIDDLHPEAINSLKQRYVNNLPNLETRMTKESVQPRITSLEKKAEFMMEWIASLTGDSVKKVRDLFYCIWNRICNKVQTCW